MPGLLRTMEVKDLETGCFSGNGQLIGNKHTMVVINEGPGRNRRQLRNKAAESIMTSAGIQTKRVVPHVL